MLENGRKALTMDEYIKKEDIEHKIQDGLNNMVLGHDAIEVLGMIYEMPTADVAPVRHGRWVLDEKRYLVYCSECSEPVSYYPNIRDVREENHYCPNCGAKMDLEG